ncbi:STE/STE20/FRAY protein kinase [Spizellomyces punctatus DAOM BR117]|uniref:STE/STE20/FRAY protein kinase n=1 Tax=Spizellomyces punctatus (strain DAOM BR117) TaxID=645134 RepID=A0A0L0H723_SPIPD|nr:STE/STE20/FRAY protein kinase [Spizellomyces punctatus DAOM BR117]KNC96523.1 STE/STE20/FRAY protein kinase [Spizellomyces punctatus DAOM BR117]|eukprot:XP_016604563.1 STE/STE20/FRAY protein kinase [Spizellomyces punctatus DAOM BR117]
MEGGKTEGHSKRDRQATGDTQVPRQRQPSSGSTLSGIFQSKKSQRRHQYTNDIQDYELLSDIGGVDDISYLYLARHIPTGEYVALKYTDLTLSPDYELIDELIRTVRNTNLCKHRNILPYWTTFVENERMWNVTYPMRAGTFRNIMRNHIHEGFSDTVVATVMREVLKAIIYMHDNRMIHNDIRADNILLDVRGEIRLTGLRNMVSLAQGGEYIKSVFSLVGDNIEWAAPEVMAQNSNYNEKADIYSFGITALELAFNRTPFDDWPPLKILLSKLEYACPAVASEKLLSKDFYRMVSACIRKDPNRRPTARELAEHVFFKSARNARYLETHIVQRIIGGYKQDPTATVSTYSETPHVTQHDTQTDAEQSTGSFSIAQSLHALSQASKGSKKNSPHASRDKSVAGSVERLSVANNQVVPA